MRLLLTEIYKQYPLNRNIHNFIRCRMMCDIWGQIIFFLSLFLICFAKTQCKTSNYEGNNEDPVAFYVYTRQNNETAQSLKADVESIVRNILNPTKSIT